jgi:hypothetical protein
MSSLYDYIGRWGLFAGHTDYIHPDDVKFWKYIFGGVFHCRGIAKDSYLMIKYGEFLIRVQPSAYYIIPPLDFYLGDVVTIKKYPEKITRICDVGWHYKRGEPMFFLWVDGKKKSRRYFKDELEQKG